LTANFHWTHDSARQKGINKVNAQPINNELSVELSWFEDHRKELCNEHLGKFAVVHGIELIGIYDDFSTAFKSGYEKTGTPSILVKQILPTDDVFSAPALSLGLLRAVRP
jgi:hypothetical protein